MTVEAAGARSRFRYAGAALVVGTAGSIAGVVFGRGQLADVVMIYMLGIAVVALRFGRGPSLLAATLSVLSFDFFFVPPYHSLAVTNLRHIVTFGVMLFVGLVISSLTEQVRAHAEAARKRDAEAFASQIAAAALRASLAEENEKRRVEIETERLKTALLSSVSHDLRTPLAVMTGSASTLLDPAAANLPAAERTILLRTIYEEGERLGRLISDLLDITRLESGKASPKKEWCPVEEVVMAALSRLQSKLGDRELGVFIETDSMAPFDFVLIEQLLVNLLENAAKYAGPASPIEITAKKVGERLVLEVADRGPGFSPGDEPRVFEKFYRGPHEGTSSGAGLGLAIAKAVAVIHGGSLIARNRPEGGAVVSLSLPIEGTPPPAPPEAPVSPS